MYYLDKPVKIKIDFAMEKECSFHILSKFSIDYINNKTTIELGSWENIESFKAKDKNLVTFLEINDAPRFDVDPNLFALRALVLVENSPFYHHEIKNWYELQHIKQLDEL